MIVKILSVFLPEVLVLPVVLIIIFVAIVLAVYLHFAGVYTKLKDRYMAQVESVSKDLDRDFIKISPARLSKTFIAYYVFWFLVGIALALPYFAVGFIVGAVMVAIGAQLPKRVCAIIHARRIGRFGGQLVDALTLMANGLRSGLNISQTIDLVSQEMPNPISQEFGLILSQNQLGTSIEEAFENLAQRFPTEDVEMLSTAIGILRETGGNLAETFDTITYTIRERIKIKNKISALVTQGIMQGAIIMAMPFGMALMLYFIDPDQIMPMFTTPVGWAMIGFMIVMQILGGLAIWKIIDIKV